MIKIFALSFLILSTLSGDCNSWNPVCGTNGVTYANVCQCREARIDVGYKGACDTSARIEWVKRPDESMRNIKYWTPQVRAQQQIGLIPLKWADYSWEQPGWDNKRVVSGFSGFQPAFYGNGFNNYAQPIYNNWLAPAMNLRGNQGFGFQQQMPMNMVQAPTLVNNTQEDQFNIRPNWFKVQNQPLFAGHTSEGNFMKQQKQVDNQNQYSLNPAGTQLGGYEQIILSQNKQASAPKQNQNEYLFNGQNWNQNQTHNEQQDNDAAKIQGQAQQSFTWNNASWENNQQIDQQPKFTGEQKKYEISFYNLKNNQQDNIADNNLAVQAPTQSQSWSTLTGFQPAGSNVGQTAPSQATGTYKLVDGKWVLSNDTKAVISTVGDAL